MEELTIRQLEHVARVKSELLGIIRDTNLLDKKQGGITCEDFSVYHLFCSEEDDEPHGIDIYFKDEQKNSAIILKTLKSHKNIYKDKLVERPNDSTIIRRSTGDIFTVLQIDFVDDLSMDLSKPLSSYYINYGLIEPFESREPNNIGYYINGRYCPMERLVRLMSSEEERKIVGVSQTDVIFLLGQLSNRVNSSVDPILERMPKEQIKAEIIKQQDLEQSENIIDRQLKTEDNITIQHGAILTNKIIDRHLQSHEKNID